MFLYDSSIILSLNLLNLTKFCLLFADDITRDGWHPVSEAAEDAAHAQKKKVVLLRSENSGLQTLVSSSTLREADLKAELDSLCSERNNLPAKLRDALKERRVLVDKAIEADGRAAEAEEVLAREKAEAEDTLVVCL